MRRRRDLLISLSLSNLCFLDIWDTQWHANFLQNRPAGGPLAVVWPQIVTVLICTGALWTVLYCLRRFGNDRVMRMAKWAALALFCALPLNVLRIRAGLSLSSSTSTASIVIAAALAAALSIVALRRREWLLASPAILSLVLVPLLPIQLGQTLWSLRHLRSDSVFADKPASTPADRHGQQPPRILWLVFDELDGCLLFDQRPLTLALPEIDRLADQSVKGECAYPAASMTHVALPSLMTGRPVEELTWARPDQAMIRFKEARHPVSWSEQENLFTRLRDAGANAALVGWYLPYCRLIGGSLASCWWQSAAMMEYVVNRPLIHHVKAHFRSRLYYLPLAKRALKPGAGYASLLADPQARAWVREREISDYKNVRNTALSTIDDTRFDVILVHSPIPHLLGIYDRTRRELSEDDRNSYMGNLALVDVMLGEVRRKLEAAGQWEDTIVLVTSDHPLRPELNQKEIWWTQEDAAVSKNKECPYVPFLLKLTNQKKRVSISTRFNTIVIHDLILALVRGWIDSPASVAEWIEARKCEDCGTIKLSRSNPAP